MRETEQARKFKVLYDYLLSGATKLIGEQFGEWSDGHPARAEQ